MPVVRAHPPTKAVQSDQARYHRDGQEDAEPEQLGRDFAFLLWLGQTTHLRQVHTQRDDRSAKRQHATAMGHPSRPLIGLHSLQELCLRCLPAAGYSSVPHLLP